MKEKQIIRSWRLNAPAWSRAVREGGIASRKLVTDQAIVDAILRHAPASVLDLGCGEGWLSRRLARHGIDVSGVDAVAALVEAARSSGTGNYATMSYEEIAAGNLKLTVDVIACNFSLLGKESVEGLFQIAPTMLNPGGSLIVQTLHPLVACGVLPYRDGWREGSWDGFSHDFTDPAPWYFRTLESWISLFVKNGFQLRELFEPLHPETKRPASLILAGETST